MPTEEEMEGFTENLVLAVEDFVIHRDEIKDRMTATALKRFLRQVHNLRESKRSDDEIINEIDRSIRHGWKAIYLDPLTEEEEKVRYLSAPSKYKSLYSTEELEKLLS